MKSKSLRLLIILIIIFTMITIFFYANLLDNIWVTGLNDKTNYEPFSFPIKNKRILMTGATNKFSIFYGKEKFFNELKKSYETFSESKDRIQLVYDNEVYTIRNTDDYYELYGEYFIFEKGEEVYSFPFPTDKIIGKDKPIPRLSSDFYMSCDIDYLHQFYKKYESNVKIDKNTIRYKDISIKIKKDKITIIVH